MNRPSFPLLGLLCLAPAPLAFAGATLISGPIAIGINDAGNLIFSDGTIESVNASISGYTGIAITSPTSGDYLDGIAGGSFAEGWGVSAGEISAWASHSRYLGSGNLSIDGAGAAGDAFSSLTSIQSGAALSVAQTFAPAPESPFVLFQNQVTVTNTGSTALSDVRYVRVFDWDVPPTENEEYITVVGTETASFLERSHDNGFSEPDPLVERPPLDDDTLDVDYTDIGTHDSGGYFLFNFGELGAGESVEFSLYFGAAYSETEAITAIFDVGAELYGLGQSSKTSEGPEEGTPYTYIFGYKYGEGDGGIIVIPEPATLGLLFSLGTLALLPRRRRR